jgi:putative ABC transport system permease protein
MLSFVCLTAPDSKQGYSMSVVVRGVKNAFRSGIRASAVILILAVSMGLALAMLLANEAVKDRLTQVKQSVGTAISINPAGSANFQGGGEPLKTDDLAKVAVQAHVAEVAMALQAMLATEGGENTNFKIIGNGIKQGETSLESSIDPGTLGNRFQGRTGNDEQGPPPTFKLPIRMVGISGSRNEQGQRIRLTDGRQLKTGDTTSAVLGNNVAAKNKLQVGSTFQAYGETFTVVGIFESGTKFNDDAVYVPLATLQRLTEAGSEIASAVAIVDSVDNVEAAVANIRKILGEDKVDVTANEQNALVAVESLRTVEKVSLIGFAIALIAAAVIILLTMLMIVRERRREIGVLKAIGASNRSIVTQFVVEAVVLVMIGAALGMGIAALSSNSIASTLINSNTAESTSTEMKVTPGAAVNFKAVRIDGAPDLSSAKDLIGNVTTNVSARSLGYGLLAALLIAIVGSAIPAWLVTKIRPAEVLRGE